MARLRGRIFVTGRVRRMAHLPLLIGSVGEYPDDVLRMVWQLDRVELMSRTPAGTRPWAFWVFDRGEDRPAAEAVRLAELGELSPAELAAFRRRADKARPRIGTPSEHTSGGRDGSVDVRAVELWEAVNAAASRA
jgi:hypothetical protein